MRIVRELENFGLCQTGGRNILNLGGYGRKFSPKGFPSGMPDFLDMSDLPDFSDMSSFPGKTPGGFDFGKFPNELKNLPFDSIFSQMLSSVNTVLIFLIPVFGFISLALYKKQKNKFD